MRNSRSPFLVGIKRLPRCFHIKGGSIPDPDPDPVRVHYYLPISHFLPSTATCLVFLKSLRQHLTPRPQPTPTPTRHRSPSPPLMATPSPPQAPSSPPNRTKKLQPLPWSHQETTHLIQAYREKWYSLKRGQLKASQWEEVAVTVAARCNYDDPSKSATQCRHKVEKLRKRYRAEKQRIIISAASSSSSWPYFHLMDSLERGPLPISAQPMSVLEYQKAYPYSHNCKPNDDNVGNDDYSNSSNDEDSGALKTRSRSINYILQRPAVFNGFAVDPQLNHGTEREETGAAVVDGGKGVVWELAGEMRAFSESFVRMENMKMEMMKETERRRMEMENRRMEMIVESQRKIVETIGKALASDKKLKMSQEI